MLVLNGILAFIVIRNVGVESQLEIRSKYRWGQLVVASLLVIWGAGSYGGLTSFSDLLFWTLFFMVNIMMGTGGLATHRLVLPGAWFRRTIKFEEIAGIEIAAIPAIPAIEKKTRVIVKFILNSHREISMVFNGTVTTVKTALQAKLGQQVAIEISKFE